MLLLGSVSLLRAQDSYLYDFEDGTLQGWNAIDLDGDGYNWNLRYNVDNFDCHSGIGMVYSESYVNDYGALTPDNWLVSPAAGNYSGVSLWACGQDPSWCSEVFGVFVSTDGNSWTQAGSDCTATGSWVEYNFDLSSFSKDAIWVAIRHYNVTDMFQLNVDDITLIEGSNPGPGPGPEPPTGLITDFEDNSLQGWTAIDQDGDGNNWEVLEGADGINYHEGSYYVCSESYINYVGALTPDNWLVSPAAGNYSSISFWACGQDPSYASEVFGVFVSTDGNSWTQVGSDVTATGTDTEYTFDLSSYSKDAIWVAIRHYHVTDMFRLNLDYITLGANAGVAENDANVFSVYPNPATSTLYIDGAEGETVSVYDATGRLVMQEVYNGQLNVSTLEKGIYAVRVGTNVVRFVKE